MSSRLDEEGRAILRKIVESMAWRQIASIDILGHCLKYCTDLETKVRVAAELDLSLGLFRRVHALYRELGWEDLESAVRDRVERIPFPESRLEFGAAHYLCALAEEVAMTSYAESASPEFAAIARSYVEAAPHRPQPNRFLEFARDPSNRPLVRQYLARWLTIALASFGRPGSRGDRRAGELGLRAKGSGAMRSAYLERIGPFVAQCGLETGDLEGIAGIEYE
jgi:hypothetical protein